MSAPAAQGSARATLRLTLALCLSLLLGGIALVSAAAAYRESRFEESSRQRQRLSALVEREADLSRALGLARLQQHRLQLARAQGLYAPESRLAWVERLQALGRTLPRLAYRVAPRRRLSEGPPALLETATTLQLTLRHSQELLVLLGTLQRGGDGLLGVSHCALERMPAGQGEPGQPAGLRALCRLHRWSIEEPGMSPQGADAPGEGRNRAPAGRARSPAGPHAAAGDRPAGGHRDGAGAAPARPVRRRRRPGGRGVRIPAPRARARGRCPLGAARPAVRLGLLSLLTVLSGAPPTVAVELERLFYTPEARRMLEHQWALHERATHPPAAVPAMPQDPAPPPAPAASAVQGVLLSAAGRGTLWQAGAPRPHAGTPAALQQLHARLAGRLRAPVLPGLHLLEPASLRSLEGPATARRAFADTVPGGWPEARAP